MLRKRTALGAVVALAALMGTGVSATAIPAATTADRPSADTRISVIHQLGFGPSRWVEPPYFPTDGNVYLEYPGEVIRAAPSRLWGMHGVRWNDLGILTLSGDINGQVELVGDTYFWAYDLTEPLKPGQVNIQASVFVNGVHWPETTFTFDYEPSDLLLQSPENGAEFQVGSTPTEASGRASRDSKLAARLDGVLLTNTTQNTDDFPPGPGSRVLGTMTVRGSSPFRCLRSPRERTRLR